MRRLCRPFEASLAAWKLGAAGKHPSRWLVTSFKILQFGPGLRHHCWTDKPRNKKHKDQPQRQRSSHEYESYAGGRPYVNCLSIGASNSHFVRLVGRVAPCAPVQGSLRANGAHGVTRPDAVQRFQPSRYCVLMSRLAASEFFTFRLAVSHSIGPSTRLATLPRRQVSVSGPE